MDIHGRIQSFSQYLYSVSHLSPLKQVCVQVVGGDARHVRVVGIVPQSKGVELGPGDGRVLADDVAESAPPDGGHLVGRQAHCTERVSSGLAYLPTELVYLPDKFRCVKKNLSPLLRFLNCFPMMHAKVGPTRPSSTGLSATPALNRSISPKKKLVRFCEGITRRDPTDVTSLCELNPTVLRERFLCPCK